MRERVVKIQTKNHRAFVPLRANNSWLMLLVIANDEWFCGLNNVFVQI